MSQVYFLKSDELTLSPLLQVGSVRLMTDS